MSKTSQDITLASPRNYILSTSFQKVRQHGGRLEKLAYTRGIYFKETNTKAQRAEDEADHMSTGVCLSIEKKEEEEEEGEGFKVYSVMVLEECD